jgi:GxxExxY protein
MNDLLKNENDLAHIVIGMSIDIHKTLGPGLDHDSYIECLMYELEQHGITAIAKVEKDAFYKNLKLNKGYTIDLLIDQSLVVEVETSENITDMQIQKTLKILKLGGYKLGLVINFNSTLLKNGIRRISNIKQQEEV